MPVTILSTPYVYEPVYTLGMPFSLTSSFNTSENFKYLFNLQVGDGVTFNPAALIATYPQPTGEGIYSPQQSLQPYCETKLNPCTQSIFRNNPSRIYYQIQYGETYNPGLTFGETYLIAGPFGSVLGLEFAASVATTIFVGDKIEIKKDNISINPWINGTASVIGITPSTVAGFTDTVFTDKPLDPNGVFSALESGEITNISRYSGTSSAFVGWNAARQYGDFSDFRTTYVMEEGTTQSNFLSVYETAYASNLTQKKCIYLDQCETLDFLMATYSLGTYSTIYIQFDYYDLSGTFYAFDTIEQTYTTLVDQLTARFTTPVGTSLIATLTNGSVIINNGTLGSYTVRVGIGNSPGGPSYYISDFFNYTICQNCRPFPVVRLAFLNKLGGFDYWNFNLVSKYNSAITRKQINRALTYDYKTGDRGRDVIYSEGVENWVINTDFLTDDDALFIRELVESSNVFVLEDGGTYPIIITQNNWEYKSGLLNGYVQYTIEYQKSYDVIINR